MHSDRSIRSRASSKTNSTTFSDYKSYSPHKINSNSNLHSGRVIHEESRPLSPDSSSPSAREEQVLFNPEHLTELCIATIVKNFESMCFFFTLFFCFVPSFVLFCFCCYRQIESDSTAADVR